MQLWAAASTLWCTASKGCWFQAAPCAWERLPVPAAETAAVSCHTRWWHPESEGNPRSDPLDKGAWEFSWMLGVGSVHKNNLAQVAGLNSLAFSCLALFLLPRVTKKDLKKDLFFNPPHSIFFCFVSRITNTERNSAASSNLEACRTASSSSTSCTKPCCST